MKNQLVKTWQCTNSQIKINKTTTLRTTRNNKILYLMKIISTDGERVLQISSSYIAHNLKLANLH